MPRYRFQVNDGDARLRTGTIEAETLDDARKQILNRGFEVVSLQALAGSVSAAPFEEPDLEIDSPPRRLRLDVAMALVGVLGLASCIYSLRPAQAVSAAQPPHVPCLVEISGSLHVEGSKDLSDVQLVLDFPDVPVQWTRSWSSVAQKTPGQFRLAADFDAPVKPRRCVFTARKPGHGDVVQELALGQLPAHFQRTVTLRRY